MFQSIDARFQMKCCAQKAFMIKFVQYPRLMHECGGNHGVSGNFSFVK